MYKLAHDIEKAANAKLASIGRYLPAVGGGILGGLGGVAVTNDDDSELLSILKPLLGAAIGGTIGYNISGAPPIPPKYQVFGPDDQPPIFNPKDAKYNPLDDLAEAVINPRQKAIGYVDPLSRPVVSKMDAKNLSAANQAILDAFNKALDDGDMDALTRIVTDTTSIGAIK